MTGVRILLGLCGIVFMCLIALSVSYQWLARSMVNQFFSDYQVKVEQLDFHLDSLQSMTINQLSVTQGDNQLVFGQTQLQLPVPFYRFSLDHIAKTRIDIHNVELQLNRFSSSILNHSTVNTDTAAPPHNPLITTAANHQHSPVAFKFIWDKFQTE